jgi:CDP-diacylglycerol--glycerol-3-phosphate 3-phosphatidyltransferase
MYFRFIPNILSFSRIVISPIFAYFLIKNIFLFNLIALLIFFIGSLTDILDGYIARKYNIGTEIGKYIDPLADKILVVTAFCVLSYFYPLHVPIWMIFVILLRDIFIMFYRTFLIKKNISLETSKSAKFKTFYQIVIIHLLLIIHVFNPSIIIFNDFTYILISVSLFLSVITAIQYVISSFSKDN